MSCPRDGASPEPTPQPAMGERVRLVRTTPPQLRNRARVPSRGAFLAAETSGDPDPTENLRATAPARQFSVMRASLLASAAIALCACGGPPAASPAQSPVSAPQQPPAGQPAASPPQLAVAATAPTADHALKRSQVHGAVAQGLGVFLQRVELSDQPVRVDGKFHGFRIAALRDAKFWSGVDLKPGDVVTTVNGFPIERPEQAQTAFDSLEVASELRITYERDGKPREIVYPIVEDR